MKRPFIFFPAIDYQSLYQRPQHMASILVEKGYDVYFRNVGQVGGREPVIIDGVNIYQDWDRHPTEIDDKGIYIINYPSFVGYRNWTEDDFMIYDCVDDFPDFEPYQKNACDVANLVTYTSDKIKTNIDEIGDYKNQEFLKLPNGVNSNFGSTEEIAEEIKELKSKYTYVLGFVGAMHYSWVDVDLLHRIAKENPTWAIVLIGNTYTWDFNQSQAPSNLIRLGTKDYKELDTYYNGCDVGLITFLDNQISQGSDPIKLYEYAACGIPIVSSNLSFSRDLPEPICYKYDTYEGCILQIKNAINQNNSENIDARKKFALKNTWSARVDDLLEKIAKINHLEV